MTNCEKCTETFIKGWNVWKQGHKEAFHVSYYVNSLLKGFLHTDCSRIDAIYVNSLLKSFYIHMLHFY